MQQVVLMKPFQAIGVARNRQLIDGVISSLPLFRQVSPCHVAEVASHARTWEVRRGTGICSRGAHLPGVIAVAYGMVKLALARPNGEERVVRFVNAGETFGEASALFDRPCRVDAGALAHSMLVVIPPRTLLRLLELDPKFARRMLGVLAERVHALLGELESSVRQRGPQRLACYLQSLARPGETPDAWHVSLPATKTVVASRLGVSKETLSRLLRRFSDQGLLAISRNDITILDRERLARVAAGGGTHDSSE